jgi:hypothetical protein
MLASRRKEPPPSSHPFNRVRDIASTHDFTVFAWYRIVFGVVVLLTAYTGWVEWKA